jgi:hypothetical protein
VQEQHGRIVGAGSELRNQSASGDTYCPTTKQEATV